MTADETTRLARVEQKVENIMYQLNENTNDTKAIRHLLDNLSGGKQALMWLTGLIISVATALAMWLGIHHK